MPLIDLLADPANFIFNSKSRQFGNDRPGAGDSGLPYIKFPIDSPNVLGQFKQYYSTNRTGLDFPIRGGSVTFNLGNQSFTPSSDIDKERIKKFLQDDPRGKAFLLKQTGLQLSNPKIQTGNTINTLRSQNIPGLIENTRLYNDGKNTIAQVGVEGTGIHFTRHGLSPFNPLEKYYSDVVGAEAGMSNQEAIDNNRLLILASLKLKQKTTANQVSTIGSVSNIDSVNRLGISLNRDLLFQYLGGPGSVYGVGSTTIKRAKGWDTTEAINYKQMPMSTLAMTYDKLMEQKSTRPNSSNGIITSYKDFRDQIDNYSGQKMSGSNWGNGNTQTVDYRFYVHGTRSDKMNHLRPFKFKSDELPWTNKENADDIIKFVFECINNSDTDQSVALFFRAHLGSISDNNTGQWNGFKYMGRGENFYTYGGFDRTIGFSFKIAVQSRSELDSVYDKLNWLMSQVYPDYSVDNYMRAPIIKLTIGDYLYRVPGFLENINVSINETSPWEIDEGSQLPHYIDVSTSFKPILSNIPKKANFDTQSDNRLQNTDLIRQNYISKTTSTSPSVTNQAGANPANQPAVSSTPTPYDTPRKTFFVVGPNGENISENDAVTGEIIRKF